MKKLTLLIMLFLIPLNVSAVNETARSSIVMDIDSGRILFENNSNEQRLIASITKIMTAVIALEKGNLNDVVTVGDEVLKMYGTSIYITKGEKMTLRDLLYGLMLRSGNDAAVVIANHIAKNEEAFVALMNEKAKELGMTNTVFHNAHGLDEETENLSSAKDMALLSRYAYRHFKDYRTISGTKKHLVKTIDKTYLWNNRVKLLQSYERCTGGKNGYTPRAGKTLVTTARKDDFNITTVTLKDNDEYNHHEALDEYIFDTFDSYLIVDKNNFTIQDKNIAGTPYVKTSFRYPLTKEESEHVSVVAHVDPTLKKGKIGNITVTLYQKELKKIPIYLKQEPSKKKSFWDSFKWW